MRELFIYYKVARSAAAEARRAVAAMQRELRASHSGLATRLLVRDDAQGDMQTWMETYALAGDVRGVGPGLEATIERHSVHLRAFIEGHRHVEAFETVDPP